MFCNRCGAVNPEGASFCGKCGSALAGPTAAPRSGQAAPVHLAAYAGFWKRLAAWLIDAILVNVASLPIVFIFGSGLSPEDFGVGGFWRGFLSLGMSWLYYALMESSAKQATVGKMALGIMVTDTQGRRMTFGLATGRFFAKILSGLIIGIGFLMIAFTEKKQGLHDMLANTLVVER